MNTLDGLLVLLLGLSVFAGWRRGFLQQGLGLAGTTVGVVVGAALAPEAMQLGHLRLTRLAFALGAVVVFAAIGNILGFLAGRALRARVSSGPGRKADSAFGAVMSVLTLLLGTWFLGVNLAGGPFPVLAGTLQGSAIVRAMGALPPPPPLFEQIGRLADRLGFPDLFIGVPPLVAEPVAPPGGPVVRAAAAAGQPSTFEVRGGGCDEQLLNQGSGFVVAPGYLLTNAHVVAGADQGLWVQEGVRRHDARLVVLDTDLDVAILHVPSLSAPPLELAAAVMRRGTAGAVLGFPGGPPLQVEPAAVRGILEPTGRDIYGRGRVERRVYELQTIVRRGNSGGPFVLPDGRVAGVVFAASVSDDRTGYAIVSTEVRGIVDDSVGRTSAVPAGRCVV